MPKILFVCSENRLRSPTAAAVFAEYEGVEAIGAGTNPDSTTPVSAALIEWADVILVMEERHRKLLQARFHRELGNKKIGVLGLPDIYDFMEPVLVQLLKEKVPSYVRVGQNVEMNEGDRKFDLPAWAIVLDVIGTLLLAAGIYALVGGDDLLFSDFLDIRPFAIPLIVAGVLLMLPLVGVLMGQVTRLDRS